MKYFAWQLQNPIDAIIFDCDGTLSSIEGIDELAKLNGVAHDVELLTADVMGQTGLNPELYQKRLDLVLPKQQQVIALGQHYFENLAPDADHVIQLFHRLHKAVYLVSAGIYSAVNIFGNLLHIPSTHIFAVEIQFDANGNYVDFDHTSPLTHHSGKRDIVTQLKQQHPHILHIGDGLNDYSAHDIVTRFVGYGGAFYRENIASRCEYYIRTASMTPLIPLTLTATEQKNLTADEQLLFEKGLHAIQAKLVKV